MHQTDGLSRQGNPHMPHKQMLSDTHMHTSPCCQPHSEHSERENVFCCLGTVCLVSQQGVSFWISLCPLNWGGPHIFLSCQYLSSVPLCSPEAHKNGSHWLKEVDSRFCCHTPHLILMQIYFFLKKRTVAGIKIQIGDILLFFKLNPEEGVVIWVKWIRVFFSLYLKMQNSNKHDDQGWISPLWGPETNRPMGPPIITPLFLCKLQGGCWWMTALSTHIGPPFPQ